MCWAAGSANLSALGARACPRACAMCLYTFVYVGKYGYNIFLHVVSFKLTKKMQRSKWNIFLVALLLKFKIKKQTFPTESCLVLWFVFVLTLSSADTDRSNELAINDIRLYWDHDVRSRYCCWWFVKFEDRKRRWQGTLFWLRSRTSETTFLGLGVRCTAVQLQCWLSF